MGFKYPFRSKVYPNRVNKHLFLQVIYCFFVDLDQVKYVDYLAGKRKCLLKMNVYAQRVK